jgi:hypothetical protein
MVTERLSREGACGTLSVRRLNDPLWDSQWYGVHEGEEGRIKLILTPLRSIRWTSVRSSTVIWMLKDEDSHKALSSSKSFDSPPSTEVKDLKRSKSQNRRQASTICSISIVSPLDQSLTFHLLEVLWDASSLGLLGATKPNYSECKRETPSLNKGQLLGCSLAEMLGEHVVVTRE